MAPHSSTFAWKILWMEEPGGLQFMGLLESDTTERLHFHFSLSCIGEGNGNPLQCSCLENPRDGKPGWLPSMGLHRVGHDWSDAAAAAATKFRSRAGHMDVLIRVETWCFCLIYLNVIWWKQQFWSQTVWVQIPPMSFHWLCEFQC